MSPARTQLIAVSVSKSHAGHEAVRDVSMTVEPGSRIALLGPNGAGKSTLMRVLAGIEEADGGRVERTPATMSVGYLDQEPSGRPGETLLDYLERRTGIADAEATMDRLARSMGDDLRRIEAYVGAVDRYRALGGGDLEARAAAACARIGLGGDALAAPVNRMSGGQRTRAALTAIGLARFDALLLDEPTNNLDLDGLRWLERFVAAYRGGIVVTSHDRAFLDRCVDRFLELDPFTHRASEYIGTWSEYEAERDRSLERRRRAHGRSVAERDALLSRAREIRREAGAGVHRAAARPRDGDKHAKRRAVSSAQRHAARAAAMERRASRVDIAEKPRTPWRLHMSLETPGRSAKVVARLSGAVIELDAFRLGPLDVEVHRGDRIAVVGPNGAGKTTLLRALLGELPLAAGTRHIGSGSVLGTMAQDRAAFAAARPLLESFVRRTGMRPEEARTLLAKFDLGADDVGRTGGELSPGERSRATLAELVARRTNVLVLDEPTNHLDLPAIEELENALIDFPGTLLIASHDRRLMGSLALTRSLELRDGTVRPVA